MYTGMSKGHYFLPRANSSSPVLGSILMQQRMRYTVADWSINIICIDDELFLCITPRQQADDIAR